MTEVTVPGPHGEVPAYLAVPAGTGPWPGVVVVHEIFGLNDDIRRIAERFASNGYLALAPNLNHAGSQFSCMRSAFSQLKSGKGSMHDEIDAARSWLVDRVDCTDRVGVIGFCSGGGFALLAAPRGFAAASVNYGQIPDDVAAVLQGGCPLVGSFGGSDRSLRGKDLVLDAALTELGIEHDVKTYPQAGHSFMNQHKANPLFSVLGAVLNAGYDADAAEDSWNRILAFFGRHLQAA